MAYEFGGHTIVQSIAKSLRLSFTCREFIGKYPVREGEREHRGLWSWAGPSECSEMRQGIDLHIDLSLATGCCLGRV